MIFERAESIKIASQDDGTVPDYTPRRDGSIDVKGREIRVRKSVEIKGFPRGWTVWTAVPPLGFFCFSQYAETNPQFKMSEG